MKDSRISKQWIGKRGEQIAKDYLIAQGMQVVEQNWRYGKTEIDIIGIQNDMLIFIEVKARIHTTRRYPDAAVSIQKQKNILHTAFAYLEEMNWEAEVRFDVLSIHIDESGNGRCFHIQDAFFPNWMENI